MEFYQYTIQSVANRYHVTSVTVARWIKEGKLKATEQYGCRPKWYISEKDLAEFELNYIRREGIKPHVVKSTRTFEQSDFCCNALREDTEEEMKLMQGLKKLNKILESYPYLKDMILELADRL